MEFLRDTGWQTVLAGLGIVVAVVIFLLQQNKKRLGYSVLTATPLLSIDEGIRAQIEIKYEKKKIQNIHLVILKIENIGNVPISSTDYEEPLAFAFPNSEILSMEVISSSPKNLKPTGNTTTTELTFDPILLNRKDYFVCKLLFSKYEEKMDVAARIIGVKEVERIYSQNRNRADLVNIMLFGITISVTTYLIWFGDQLSIQGQSLATLATIILMVVALIYSYSRLEK